ncbi:GAF domain-containing sensor histidine kinase [Massilia sp. R2A-15]|uniref:GAF domain-containing sensor histidine kinase n=1 Tax=Massilia sp. R2A-15 TaxID=3064278 RepID=UPI002735F18A|nr:GAF domain-containing sensor histidine kinase [Massilia sp. R2A-15]WLI90541.1 GAF domain-containing sensor histidine kinase [Massilia sp. R2A-15]
MSESAHATATLSLVGAADERRSDVYLTHALSGPHRDLLELTARGAPVDQALNAVVRAVSQVRRAETRAAVFIFDPEGMKLRFAAADGLDAGYTDKIDNFPVGPAQPSCGRAAYVGTDIIVGDVGTDAAWAPFRELAEEHGIRACWSFLLKGPNDRVLGTFALYHRIPCEPESTDYEEVRYFSNIASLIIERHLDAEARKREQEATEKDLRESGANKDAFLATLAHELRNPLGAIKHGLAIIELAADQAGTRTRALQAVDRQLKHMEWLVEDLLDANRVTRGDLTLRLQHVELGAALDLACETVRPLCAAKAQTLTVTTPSQPVYLEADAVRVTQMVTNLLNNACKFTGKDGRIFLEVTTEGADVLIRVRDEGVGIAADQLGRVFEMFSQVSKGPGSPHDGLGIGLTLVRSLARMHGGSVEASSAGIGAGSEFLLRLPLKQH